MLVLGVDPGLTRCGVGVVDGSPGRARLIEAGVIRTPTTDQTADRLLAIEQGLEDWLDRFRPEAVAIERVFAQHNLASVVGTAQAAGVAMLVAARHQLPTAQHTPSEVKAAITGSGRADKAQVGLMVARVLHLTDPPKPADAADAVALAVCHIWRSAVQDRLTLAINRSENQQHLMKTTQQLAARPHRQSSSRNYQVTK